MAMNLPATSGCAQSFNSGSSWIQCSSKLYIAKKLKLYLRGIGYRLFLVPVRLLRHVVIK